MKRVITLLLVGFLVLGAPGTVASSDDKIDANSMAFQQEIVVTARGGFGVTVAILNYGNTSIENVGDITVTVRATILLRGGYSILKTPISVPPDSSVSQGTGLILGIGRCTVKVAIDIDNDGVKDGENSTTGLIFLPFVIIEKFNVTLDL
jgi:hypothetical protein